jgi:hypothetical protein
LLRRAITASQYTAARRRACGTAAHTSHSSKPAFWGRRPLPRPTRRTSRPRGHAEQALPPHQRLLPCLLTTHRRSLRNGSRRCTTSAMSPSPRTTAGCVPGMAPRRWPACATLPLACFGVPATPTSPRRYVGSAGTPLVRLCCWGSRQRRRSRPRCWVADLGRPGFDAWSPLRSSRSWTPGRIRPPTAGQRVGNELAAAGPPLLADSTAGWRWRSSASVLVARALGSKALKEVHDDPVDQVRSGHRRHVASLGGSQPAASQALC